MDEKAQPLDRSEDADEAANDSAPLDLLIAWELRYDRGIPPRWLGRRIHRPMDQPCRATRVVPSSRAAPARTTAWQEIRRLCRACDRWGGPGLLATRRLYRSTGDPHYRRRWARQRLALARLIERWAAARGGWKMRPDCATMRCTSHPARRRVRQGEAVMAQAKDLRRDVLLVGSVPLGSAEEVFEAASEELGDRLARIPDGETGARTNWIAWQRPVLAAHPKLEPVATDLPIPQFAVRPEAAGDAIAFGPLGYAAAARESYASFAKLKAAGRIPAAMRFQVSLPTTMAVTCQYIVQTSQALVEPGYRARLRAELDEIVAAIPHDQLAIQWDVAVEFAVLEGVSAAYFDDPFDGIVARLVADCASVPATVEMGIHLCYGDPGHRHFVEPKDTANLVAVANAVSAGVAREIAWIHMPVPRERTDDAYYAPLANLALHPETRLYLGLVHYTDGLAGTRARIEAAAKMVPAFGIATECGLGRRPPETIPELLRIHRAAAG
jgi:hypothetical protein